LPAFRQGQEACNSSLAETFGEQALAPVATGSVGPLPGCTESSNRTISADVLVQSPVTDGLKSAGPTSLPSSVPAVETLLSRADGQLTPPPAHVLVQTSVSDRLACPVSTSRKDSDNVPSDVPSRTTSGVHPVELRPGAKWDQRSSFRWSQAKAKVCRERHRVVLGRDQSGVQAVMDYPASTNRRQNQWRSRPRQRRVPVLGPCHWHGPQGRWVLVLVYRFPQVGSLCFCVILARWTVKPLTG